MMQECIHLKTYNITFRKGLQRRKRAKVTFRLLRASVSRGWTTESSLSSKTSSCLLILANSATWNCKRLNKARTISLHIPHTLACYVKTSKSKLTSPTADKQCLILARVSAARGRSPLANTSSTVELNWVKPAASFKPENSSISKS